MLSLSQFFPRLLSATRNIINLVIDFFHKPFARIMPLQTFRYIACGGGNTVLGLVVYSLAYNIILNKESTHIYGNVNITAPVGAQILSTCVTFPLGFALSRYIIFPESNLRGRKQLFRYALMNLTFVLLTYVLIKIFAALLPMVRADISFIFICFILAILSYITQRFFAFKTTEEEMADDIL